jgi:hypothetical protein
MKESAKASSLIPNCLWGAYLYADIDGLDRFFDTGKVKVRRITNRFLNVFCAMQHG